jgi:hypothetical protein
MQKSAALCRMSVADSKRTFCEPPSLDLPSALAALWWKEDHRLWETVATAVRVHAPLLSCRKWGKITMRNRLTWLVFAGLLGFGAKEYWGLSAQARVNF